MSTEVANWEPIRGFDQYEISSLGQVRNVETKRVLCPRNDKDGYLTIGLWSPQECRKRHLKIHRIVLDSFMGPGNGLQANHIDGCKSNNRLENLEWTTQSENMRHAYRLGLQIGKGARGELAGKAKLKEHQVYMIRALCHRGIPHRTIARMFGVCPTTISNIRTRTTWNHI